MQLNMVLRSRNVTHDTSLPNHNTKDLRNLHARVEENKIGHCSTRRDVEKS
jgi:hypothetical protein